MNHATTTPSELADARYDASVEQARAAFNIADLTDELTPAECRQIEAEALLGRPTMVLADVAERIMRRKTGELLDEATRAARNKPMPFDVWHQERLMAEAGR
jgi:hypothetical protein